MMIGAVFQGREGCKMDCNESITSVDFLTQPVTHHARRAAALLSRSA